MRHVDPGRLDLRRHALTSPATSTRRSASVSPFRAALHTGARSSRAALRSWGAATTCLLPLLATGCKDSWATTQKQLAMRMTQVDAAVASAASLPACAAGADEGHLPLSETSLLAMKKSVDFVQSGRSGVTPLCRFDARVVEGATNPFNAEGIRASEARAVLAAKGYAVIVTDSATPPTERGNGQSAGRIVLVTGQGKAECKIAWAARNSEQTTVQVGALSAKVGIGPSPEAMRKAWESNLQTNTCNEIVKALPRARASTNRPNG